MINFEKPKYLLYCFIRINDRYPEIAFSGHQNAENEHNETLNKNVQN